MYIYYPHPQLLEFTQATAVTLATPVRDTYLRWYSCNPYPPDDHGINPYPPDDHGINPYPPDDHGINLLLMQGDDGGGSNGPGAGGHTVSRHQSHPGSTTTVRAGSQH